MDVLVIRLAAPMMSFGDVSISEDRSPVMRHPALSMIAGLLANALGFDHSEPWRTQELQDAIEIASLEAKAGKILTDYQSSRLEKADAGWTTSGTPMSRAGHDYTYLCPAQRWKDYACGAEVLVAIRSSQGAAHLDLLEEAVKRPARPVFIGRRNCLPTKPLFAARMEAPSLREALEAFGSGHARVPAGEATPRMERVAIADRRDWMTRCHGGERQAAEGMV